MALKTKGTQLWFKKDDSTLVEIVIKGVTGLGGGRDNIDITNLMSDERENLAGFATPDAIAIPVDWDPSNTSHRDLRVLYDSGETVQWYIGASDGIAPPTISAGVVTKPTTRSWMSFSGYVSNYPIDAAVNDAYRSPVTLQRSGKITVDYKTP